ncbi:MAG: putative membrane protein [Pseudolabrys sp.]|jgi:hypothetical protein|nr:putative membrane protein [Pseudolabrys sp.]
MLRPILSVTVATLLSLALSLGISRAQTSEPPLPPPAAATSTPTSPPPPAADTLLKPEQLEQLVSPIALYPDTLLAQVLIASTYPLEVVEASRWLTTNKNLKGAALKDAVDKQKWDDSVKGLIATPEVLDIMSNKLSWTKDLGDAVLAQQADVMDAVQRLRKRAEDNKKLVSTKQQKVSTKNENNKQVIVIESAVPDTIYVPYYDPAVVYGPWPYPAYPPYYYPPPYGYGGAVLATGIAFATGVALGAWAGRYWGGGCNWNNNNININNNFNRVTHWQHNPAHREGVRYNNSNVAKQFGKGEASRGSVQNRMDFRGRDGQQVLNPSRGNTPSAGQRPSTGQRPSGGDRPSAGQRPSTGQRPSAGQGPSTGQRPASRPSTSRDNALSISNGQRAQSNSARGHSSLGGRNAASFSGGGGARGGGGGGRGGGGRGGGRRGDIGTFDIRFAQLGSARAAIVGTPRQSSISEGECRTGCSFSAQAA